MMSAWQTFSPAWVAHRNQTHEHEALMQTSNACHQSARASGHTLRPAPPISNGMVPASDAELPSPGRSRSCSPMIFCVGSNVNFAVIDVILDAARRTCTNTWHKLENMHLCRLEQKERNETCGLANPNAAWTRGEPLVASMRGVQRVSHSTCRAPSGLPIWLKY